MPFSETTIRQRDLTIARLYELIKITTGQHETAVIRSASAQEISDLQGCFKYYNAILDVFSVMNLQMDNLDKLAALSPHVEAMMHMFITQHDKLVEQYAAQTLIHGNIHHILTNASSEEGTNAIPPILLNGN